MVLAPHLQMVVWLRKFRPHMSEKYDGTVNPTEFLQIYSTSILTAGRDEAVMANYFPVALTRTAQSWLMNLSEGSLTFWQKLCHQFMVNFESAYSRPGNETDLHAVQQRPGESLRSFIQRFSQVHNTIPCISNASAMVAFRQGVRDEKMLEKLATHDIKDVAELFSLADKCVRAAEGRAWHTPPAPEAGKGVKPDASAATQGGSNKNNKKKAGGNNQPLAGAPTAAQLLLPQRVGAEVPMVTSTPGIYDGGTRCPVHNSMHHSAEECGEIKKLVK
jgi:hypothetical protein